MSHSAALDCDNTPLVAVDDSACTAEGIAVGDLARVVGSWDDSGDRLANPLVAVDGLSNPRLDNLDSKEPLVDTFPLAADRTAAVVDSTSSFLHRQPLWDPLSSGRTLQGTLRGIVAGS